MILYIDSSISLNNHGDMMIRTVEQFVSKIGGNTSAATAFDVSTPAICNWKSDGRFPAWAFMRVREIAEVNKLTVDPKLFSASRPTRKKGAA